MHTSKNKAKYQTFEGGIVFKGHPFAGFVWKHVSSRTGESYNVTLTQNGFTCDCIAGSMRGKCKHAQATYDRLTAADPMPKDMF